MLVRFGKLTLIFLLLLAGRAPACGPFLRVPAGPTLRQEFAQARIVLFGTLENARLPAADTTGSVDLKIERVLKDDPFLAGKQIVAIDRYIPIPDPKAPSKFLIFCDVFKGKLDPYKGITVQSEALLRYLDPLAAEPKRCDLLYFFRHLDHADPAVADDALMEFVQADYRDVVPLARKLPAEQLARWLQVPKLPAARVRLYATLLGDCGTGDHADLLRRMQADAADSSGADGLLVGYTLLQPKAGMTLLGDTLKDSRKSFARRLDALQAVRFLHDFRPERVERQLLLEAMCLTLDQGDIMEVTVEMLRQLNYSKATERVLAGYSEQSPLVVRRVIIRFALSFPKDPRAVMFIVRLRQQQPEIVKDVEESMSLEQQGRPALAPPSDPRTP